jgi:hypothetical protein
MGKKKEFVPKNGKKTEKPKIEKQEKLDPTGLQWIQIYDMRLIPKKMIEAANDTELSAEQVINYQATICRNPLNILYTFVDNEWKIKGFAWFNIFLLKKQFCINMMYLDEKYQKTGKFFPKFMENVIQIIKNLPKEIVINKITGVTSHPKDFEKYGFKQPDTTFMELELENKQPEV